MVTKLQKAERLSELKSDLQSHQSVLVVNYSYFMNEQIDFFRDEIFSSTKDKITFIKNNLATLAMKDALDEKDAEASDEKIKNSNFLVFSNDIFGTIRALNKLIKGMKNYPKTKMTIACGILDNGFLDEQKIKMFADIPSIDSIYANLISILSSPLQNLVKICNSPMVDLCKVLEYKVNKC